uniref:Uncharacterized protein n=1 Tax=Anguilla anguilla TaxID=7936 RepID=A0A0E9PD64_ANGAN
MNTRRKYTHRKYTSRMNTRRKYTHRKYTSRMNTHRRNKTCDAPPT